MTADVELLPLPKPRMDASEGGLDWTDDEMTDYARANVEHHTAAKDAEIEALRAEVAEWKEAYQHAADSCLEHASRAKWMTEALREIAHALYEAAAALKAAWEDAERYRWLREEGSPDSDSGVAVSIESWGDWGRPQTTYPSGADLDAAIDQARGKDIVPEQETK